MPVSPRIRVLAAAAAAATGLTLGVAGVAHASDDSGPEKCADFAKILDAQVALDLDKVLFAALDVELGGLKNGIACDLPRHEEEDDDPSCADFDSQEDAQEALDDNEDLAEFLDGNGNGIACERLLDDGDDRDDGDDDGDNKDDDSHDKKDDDDSDGGQVKVYPSGGVDTGGAA